MSRLITTAADLLGTFVAMMVAVFALFQGVGVVTTAVRAGMAGVGVAVLARVVGWSVAYMLKHSSNDVAGAPVGAAVGPTSTPDATPGAGTHPEGE